MLKIYTPKEWYSAFAKYPALIIEDDGLIYSEKDYYDLIKKPIGKIDFERGFIYGEDYLDFIPRPIGKVVEKNGCKFIYGENYLDFAPNPILIIKGNAIYTYDEYYSLVSKESGFIEGSFPSAAERTSEEPVLKMPDGYDDDVPLRMPEGYENAGSDKKSGCSGVFGIIVGVLIALAIIAVCCWASYNILFTDVLDEFEQKVSLISIGIGALLALLFGKDAIQAILIVFFVPVLATLSFEIRDFFIEEVRFGDVIALIFSPLVLIPSFGPPAVLVGGIIGGIKMLIRGDFKKKKPNKEEKK